MENAPLEIQPTLDERCIGLSKLLYFVRQDIDVHRVIGLNVQELQKLVVGAALFWHLQRSAHIGIAMHFSKIYELPGKYLLNSVPSIAMTFRETVTNETDLAAIGRFSTKWHEVTNEDVTLIGGELLSRVVMGFRRRMVSQLGVLQDFRDKYGAHAEAGFEPSSLGSHDDYEQLFEFAYDFYQLLSPIVSKAYGASIPPHVETSLSDVLMKLGVNEPKSFIGS